MNTDKTEPFISLQSEKIENFVKNTIKSILNNSNDENGRIKIKKISDLRRDTSVCIQCFLHHRSDDDDDNKNNLVIIDTMNSEYKNIDLYKSIPRFCYSIVKKCEKRLKNEYDNMNDGDWEKDSSFDINKALFSSIRFKITSIHYSNSWEFQFEREYIKGKFNLLNGTQIDTNYMILKRNKIKISKAVHIFNAYKQMPFDSILLDLSGFNHSIAFITPDSSLINSEEDFYKFGNAIWNILKSPLSISRDFIKEILDKHKNPTQLFSWIKIPKFSDVFDVIIHSEINTFQNKKNDDDDDDDNNNNNNRYILYVNSNGISTQKPSEKIKFQSDKGILESVLKINQSFVCIVFNKVKQEPLLVSSVWEAHNPFGPGKKYSHAQRKLFGFKCGRGESWACKALGHKNRKKKKKKKKKSKRRRKKVKKTSRHNNSPRDEDEDEDEDEDIEDLVMVMQKEGKVSMETVNYRERNKNYIQQNCKTCRYSFNDEKGIRRCAVMFGEIDKFHVCDAHEGHKKDFKILFKIDKENELNFIHGLTHEQSHLRKILYPLQIGGKVGTLIVVQDGLGRRFSIRFEDFKKSLMRDHSWDQKNIDRLIMFGNHSNNNNNNNNKNKNDIVSSFQKEDLKNFNMSANFLQDEIDSNKFIDTYIEDDDDYSGERLYVSILFYIPIELLLLRFYFKRNKFTLNPNFETVIKKFLMRGLEWNDENINNVLNMNFKESELLNIIKLRKDGTAPSVRNDRSYEISKLQRDIDYYEKELKKEDELSEDFKSYKETIKRKKIELNKLKYSPIPYLRKGGNKILKDAFLNYSIKHGYKTLFNFIINNVRGVELGKIESRTVFFTGSSKTLESIDNQHTINSCFLDEIKILNSIIQLKKKGQSKIETGNMNVLTINLSANKNKPLLSAIISGNFNVVKILFKNGVSLYDPDNIPLAIASYFGRFKIFKFILKNLDNKDIDTNINMSVVLGSIWDGREKIIELLLTNSNPKIKSVIDPGAYDNQSIIMASKYGNIKIVKLLLNKGRNKVDPSDQDNEAIRIAFKNGFKNIVKLLYKDKRVLSKLLVEDNTNLRHKIEFYIKNGEKMKRKRIKIVPI